MNHVEINEKLASTGGFWAIWFKPNAIPQYYPLAHTFFFAEYQLWGLDPHYYHATNIAQHAIVVLMLWGLLTRLAVPGAWLAAAIFAVHPVHVETVAWISEQKNLLSGAFAMASMWAYFRFTPPESLNDSNAAHGSWAYYALSLFFYLAALLCKTVAVATPAVILVIFWWKSGHLRGRAIAHLVPFFLIGIALSLITIQVEKNGVGAVGPEWELTVLERTLVASRAVWFYAEKLVWPHPLKFAYPRWNIDPRDEAAYIYLIGAAILLLSLWLLRHRIGRGPLAAVLIFGGVLLPALGFFDIYYFLFSFVADHFQYHASTAIIALLASMIILAIDRYARGNAWLKGLVAVAIIVPLAILAHQQTFLYKDDGTLIRDSVKDNPDAWVAKYRYAVLLASEEQYAEAMTYFREASKLFPKHGRIHLMMADTLVAMNKDREAIEELDISLPMRMGDDDTFLAHNKLANIYARLGRVDDAIHQYQAAIALQPDAADTLHNYGVVLRMKGRIDEALAVLEKSVKLNPENANSQHTLGVTLSNTGRPDAALDPLTKAINLDPQNGEFHESLGMLYFKMKRNEEAEDELHWASELNPSSANAFLGLGVLRAQRGDLDAAVKAFESAVKADPNNREAALNLQKAIKARDSQKQSPSVDPKH